MRNRLNVIQNIQQQQRTDMAERDSKIKSCIVRFYFEPLFAINYSRELVNAKAWSTSDNFNRESKNDLWTFFFFFFISLIADGPHHYHPACGHEGSSHLSPVHALQFLSRCKFSTLTTRQPMVEFYLLTFPRFPLRKKEHKSYFGKNRTHDFRTSRCAAYLLGHSGDERLEKEIYISSTCYLKIEETLKQAGGSREYSVQEYKQ